MKFEIDAETEKKWNPHRTGDGANDVGMIQSADVGVGIAGKRFFLSFFV